MLAPKWGNRQKCLVETLFNQSVARAIQKPDHTTGQV
jgi:hypothetical protein